MNYTLLANRIPDDTQIKKLLKELAREKDAQLALKSGFDFVQDYYLIHLGINLGLRISEMSRLTWADISEDHVLVQVGKGGKDSRPSSAKMEKLVQERKARTKQETIDNMPFAEFMQRQKMAKGLTPDARSIQPRSEAKPKANTKKQKSRTVVFGGATKKLFDEFRLLQIAAGCPCGSGDGLFQGERGQLTRHGLHRRFDYWKKRLRLPGTITFHSLRHYYATMLLERGVSLALIRDQLGHSSISVTSVYLHHTESAKEKLKGIV